VSGLAGITQKLAQGKAQSQVGGNIPPHPAEEKKVNMGTSYTPAAAQGSISERAVAAVNERHSGEAANIRSIIKRLNR
jgi:hypothetical protein